MPRERSEISTVPPAEHSNRILFPSALLLLFVFMLLVHSVLLSACLAEPRAQDLVVPFSQAESLFAAGRISEAEAVARNGLVASRGADPHGAPTAIGLTTLAGILTSTGRVQEAEPLYREALALRKRIHGIKSREYGSAANNLAFALAKLGKGVESDRLYLEALAIFRRIAGPRSLETALIENNLGELALSRGDAGAAERRFRASLAIREASLGSENLAVALSLNNLGFALSAAGRDEEAIPLFERSLAILEKTLPKDHPELGRAAQNLGEALRERGDLNRAEQLLLRALASRTATELKSERLVTENSLGELYLSMHRPKDAAGHFRSAVDLAAETQNFPHGSGSPVSRSDLTALKLQLASALLQARDFAAAEPVYRELLAGTPPLSAELQRTVRMNLALVLEQSDKLDEAIRLYESLILRPVGTPMTASYREASLRYASVLSRKGDLQRAKRETERLERELATAGIGSAAEHIEALRLLFIIHLKSRDGAAAAVALDKRRDRVVKLYGKENIEYVAVLQDDAALQKFNGNGSRSAELRDECRTLAHRLLKSDDRSLEELERALDQE